jgi:hypothetical protein
MPNDDFNLEECALENDFKVQEFTPGDQESFAATFLKVMGQIALIPLKMAGTVYAIGAGIGVMATLHIANAVCKDMMGFYDGRSQANKFFNDAISSTGSFFFGYAKDGAKSIFVAPALAAQPAYEEYFRKPRSILLQNPSPNPQSPLFSTAYGSSIEAKTPSI